MKKVKLAPPSPVSSRQTASVPRPDAAPVKRMPSDRRGAKRPWLIMLYMSADATNLQDPLATELDELLRPIRERGTDDIYVVAQVETPGAVLKRYDLSAGIPRWVASADSSDLEDFLRFARTRCPAQREALIVWGHSAGAAPTLETLRQPGDAAAEALRTQAGLFRAHLVPIDPVELAKRTGKQPLKPVDLIGFDSCYLGSLEVALQFRAHGRYMLASESSISLTGWQFDTMVEAILARPAITPLELAQSMIRAVGVLRQSPATLSLYDLSGADQVAGALQDLVKALTEALRGAVPGRPVLPPFEARLWILDAFHHALPTKVRQFLDLPDLCRRLAAQGPSGDVRGRARKVLGEISRSLLMDSVDITGHGLGGISIYCPWPRATEGEVRAGARNVELDQANYIRYLLGKTGWDRLMRRREIVVDAERRAARRQAREYMRAQATGGAGGASGGRWEAKPIEMETKPIEMAVKPIEMETKPIEMEILAQL